MPRSLQQFRSADFSHLSMHMLLTLAIVFLAIWLGAIGSGYKLPFLIHAPLVIAVGLALGHFLLPRRRELRCDDDPEHQRRGSSLLRRH
jgi:lipopolysaccharide export LptBFGC system permease protein LptF